MFENIGKMSYKITIAHVGVVYFRTNFYIDFLVNRHIYLQVGSLSVDLTRYILIGMSTL